MEKRNPRKEIVQEYLKSIIIPTRVFLLLLNRREECGRESCQLSGMEKWKVRRRRMEINRNCVTGIVRRLHIYQGVARSLDVFY